MSSLPKVIAAVQLLQKAVTERTAITLELKQEISDLQKKVSELIQRDKFATEIIDDNHTQNNLKQCESLTKVNQIMHDVDNTVHVTHAYRIGQTNKFKSRPIIACLETEKHKYTAVKQAYTLTLKKNSNCLC